MSLERYINVETIKSTNKPQYGVVYKNDDLENMGYEQYAAQIPTVEDGSLFTEVHVYTFNGDYIGSTYDATLLRDIDSNSILIDAREVFAVLGIEKGSYKIVTNIISPVFGSARKGELKPAFIQEVSPERNEIKFTISNPETFGVALQQFREFLFSLSPIDMLNNFIVNFGENEIYKVLNVRFDELDQNVFYIKTYNPISDEIPDFSDAWFGIQVIDSYTDTVLLDAGKKLIPDQYTIRGPRFDIDVDDWKSQETVYKSWNDLLDADLPTTQRILDSVITGSSNVTLNIDYTDYNNFVFYSRAENRLENFKYKIQLIESYNADKKTLNSTTTQSLANTTEAAITTIQNRIDKLVSNFDPFERWLYYQQSGSLFTHDISGSLTPWPKYESGDKYILHSYTSSIAETWYSNNLATASFYDARNYNSLWWTIPEHILMDSNNSDYVTFVNMIGEHFDNMYSYIDALTSIHDKDEHPERGAPKELLFEIAKSFGWDLQNTRSLSNLWKYKLGTDQSGSFQTSSNMRVISHEEQTQQVWKRIVNNLPYLLKTKGTSRSVKALLSIYGIPNTLLSIKEYGGPGIEDVDTPVFIEDRFGYKLNTETSSYVEIPQTLNDVATYGFGDGKWCNATTGSTTYNRYPDTYEFRFSTDTTGSTNPRNLFTIARTDNSPVIALSLVSSVALESSASISGSTEYGKLMIENFTNTTGSSQIEYSEYLPLFNDDLWTVRLYKSWDSDPTTGQWYVDIAQSLDCSYGVINFSSSLAATNNHNTTYNVAYLGGSPASVLSELNASSSAGYTLSGSGTDVYRFSGQVQAYKEYYTTYNNTTFNQHVKNPAAYHVNSLSGSFYSLYRYHPFGLDNQRWNHSTNNSVTQSSSHPNQTGILPTAVSFSGFVGDQESQYTVVNETYYAVAPKTVGNTFRSEKIRLEDNSLKFDLSPSARGETSQYDDKPTDSSRLAIVFSQTDQINREIINHMGYANLHNWVGDPEEEFNSEYNTLKNRSNEYYQKYQSRNDINAFIRILSLYDYTFFEQIKQLVPGRADLIAGILIEPDLLHRSKVKLSKRPTVTNPQYSDTIPYPVSQSGKYPVYHADIDHEPDAGITYKYNTGSVQLVEDVDYRYVYYTGSLTNICDVDIQPKVNDTGSIQVLDAYLGFSPSGALDDSKVYTIIKDPRSNACYKRKVYYYDSYPDQVSLLTNGNVQSGFDNWYGYGVTHTITGSMGIANVSDSYRYKKGIVIPQAENAISIGYNVNDLPASKNGYLLRLFAISTDFTTKNEITILTQNQALDTINYTHPVTENISFYRTGSQYHVREVRFNLPRSIKETGQVITIQTDGLNDVVLYNVGLFENKYDRTDEFWLKEAYKCYQWPSGVDLENWYYQINECSSANNSRFKGTKLSGPAINIDSSETIDGGPVVVVKQTNPNSLFISDGGADGNLRVE